MSARNQMIIYEEILREFQRGKVKYVIVGGIAVNLLGSLRTTADMDILVEMSDENLGKIVKIFQKQGYTVRQPVDPMNIANEKIRKDWIKNKHMKAFNFYKDTELKEIDIIIESPVPFTRAQQTALFVQCGRLKLPVISIDNLIKMKKRSNRPIDMADIQELREIKKLRKKIK